MPWLKAKKALPNVVHVDPFGVSNNGQRVTDINPDGTYANYTKNGYSRNELVYSCIAYRAESLPQSTIRVYLEDEKESRPLNNHPLRRLIENPNPECSEFEFWELSSTYKDLAGTAFIYIVRGIDSSVPAELWPLRPDLVGVEPGGSRINSGDYRWIYHPDPMRPEVRVGIEKKDMIRVRYPNPNPDDPGWKYFGQPPLRAAARASTVDNAATNFVSSILNNHAVPMTVIETENEITDTLHKRLTARWKAAFGNNRRGEPAFLQKGMKIHELGLSLTDLEFPDLRDVAESRVCMCFRVEPILIGAKVGLEHNAYKDYHQARLSFWEEAMVSEQRRWIEPVRKQLHAAFRGRGRQSTRIDWDNSGVLALKESENSLWERGTAALTRGGITINDFRTMVHLPRVPHGDIFLTPSGVVPTEAGEIVEIDTLEASYGMLAAEHGIELSPDELNQLVLRGNANV